MPSMTLRVTRGGGDGLVPQHSVVRGLATSASESAFYEGPRAAGSLLEVLHVDFDLEIPRTTDRWLPPPVVGPPEAEFWNNVTLLHCTCRVVRSEHRKRGLRSTRVCSRYRTSHRSSSRCSCRCECEPTRNSHVAKSTQPPWRNSGLTLQLKRFICPKIHNILDCWLLTQKTSKYFTSGLFRKNSAPPFNRWSKRVEGWAGVRPPLSVRRKGKFGAGIHDPLALLPGTYLCSSGSLRAGRRTPPPCLRLLVREQVLTREPPTGQPRVQQRGRPARRPACGSQFVCWHRLPSARVAVSLPAQGQWRRLISPPDTNRCSDPLHAPAGCPKNSVVTLPTWS
ncbi:uncharacterized protein LOC122198375 [Panthera leo]|uniref:uncharacterized protein LOC122198375 n=1 Tax=Panthera leo TaxID=9689 RepID=UPI001C69AA2F|nr:uncharacterized protein LOC122198375 [Panthera leo]